MRHCIRAAPAICGKVIKVSDEDTITVLTDDKESVRVRLWGIDAPEKNQAYGEASRKNLANLIAGKNVRLVSHGNDQYGRLLAEVFLGEENECLRQIRDGYAWHYVFYARKAEEFADAEKNARTRRLGLWKDPKPVPPWDFRRNNRKR